MLPPLIQKIYRRIHSIENVDFILPIKDKSGTLTPDDNATLYQIRRIMNIPTVAQLAAEGKQPDILFWVGCSGSFDQRAQKITKAFATILNKVGINYAILGKEEMCTGDPARRAGNEFMFQMMAYQNIQVLNNYQIKKIVTACPHCFNIIKNEYPELGGHYEVVHHASFLQSLIDEGKIKMKEGGSFKGKKITYHDSCYLGRANSIYEAPRKVLEALDAELIEMKRCRSNGLCCGAGGAQMFKEEEKGDVRINVERTREAIDTGASVIAAACPFCNTMLTDGVKQHEKEEDVEILDIAELIAASME
ncbi:MAG TPA: (Fe-S)-binding protein [Chitinophagaceae bacterium]|nr:(Fe-S)-binding protein [Chitinophagaceae bacterium]